MLQAALRQANRVPRDLTALLRELLAARRAWWRAR